jgi:hypothetical protein
MYWMMENVPINVVINPEKIPEQRQGKSHFKSDRKDGVELPIGGDFIRIHF